MPASRRALCANDSFADFRQAAHAALAAQPKAISPKYFYDARGSALFEEITALPEYYPTRTERSIMAHFAREIAAACGAQRLVVEFGAGASHKSEALLESLPAPAGYAALEIDAETLNQAQQRLRARFPKLPLYAIAADFTAPFAKALAALPSAPKLGFFPGSTLGNLDPPEAITFLRRARQSLGATAKMLIGVDLVKNPRPLVNAYNDGPGVTAAFNLNLLRRMVNDLGARLCLADFAHAARWNAGQSRIEMHLVAQRPTRIELDGVSYLFAAGESLHTENSYKYTRPQLSRRAAEAGWRLGQVWTDPQDYFMVAMLEADPDADRVAS